MTRQQQNAWGWTAVDNQWNQCEDGVPAETASSSPRPSAPWWRRSSRCRCWRPHRAPSFLWGQTCPPVRRIALRPPRCPHWRSPLLLRCRWRHRPLLPHPPGSARPHRLCPCSSLDRGPDWGQTPPGGDRGKNCSLSSIVLNTYREIT